MLHNSDRSVYRRLGQKQRWVSDEWDHTWAGAALIGISSRLFKLLNFNLMALKIDLGCRLSLDICICSSKYDHLFSLSPSLSETGTHGVGLAGLKLIM